MVEMEVEEEVDEDDDGETKPVAVKQAKHEKEAAKVVEEPKKK